MEKYICLFAVSAEHFAPYLTALRNLLLTSTTGCRGRDLNRRLFGPWASTLPLSYLVTYTHIDISSDFTKREPRVHQKRKADRAIMNE